MSTSRSSALIESSCTGYRPCTRRRPSRQQQGPPSTPQGSGKHGAAVRDVAPPTAADAAFPAAAGLCRPFAGLRFIPAAAGLCRPFAGFPASSPVHSPFRRGAWSTPDGASHRRPRPPQQTDRPRRRTGTGCRGLAPPFDAANCGTRRRSLRRRLLERSARRPRGSSIEMSVAHPAKGLTKRLL